MLTESALEGALQSLVFLVLDPTNFVNLSKSPNTYETVFLMCEMEVLFALPAFLGCCEG